MNQVATLINPSASLRVKLSILETTHRASVRSVEVARTGIAVKEEEVARGSATNRTAPIAAVGTDIVERTIVPTAVTRHRQFKG